MPAILRLLRPVISFTLGGLAVVGISSSSSSSVVFAGFSTDLSFKLSRHIDPRQAPEPQISLHMDNAAPARSANNDVILWDQYNYMGVNATTSQNFEPQWDAYDAQTADDFIIEVGDQWAVNKVEVAGAYSGSGRADSVNLYFYRGHPYDLPTTPIHTLTNLPYRSGPNVGDLIIDLDPPVILPRILYNNHYWISVQANQSYDPDGQWFWRNRWEIMGTNIAAWHNPGGGFNLPACTNQWNSRETCNIGYSDKDQVFRLSGEFIIFTPVPTVTGTPPTATTTRTSTLTHTPTPLPPTPAGTRTAATPVVTQQVFTSPTLSPLPTSVCGLYWREVPSPSIAPYRNYLLGISAASANDVWAVGYIYEPLMGTSQPLIEHWNGSSWSVIPSPNIGRLQGVDAIAQDDVWAVGSGGTLHWDGSQWSVVAHPPGNYSSVAHTSANDVWAVGIYNSQTRTIRWNGSAWNVIPSPNVGTAANYLKAVTAIAQDDVWAVGYHLETAHQTLTLHWDGTSWSVIPSPNLDGARYPTLLGVDAVSSDDVWAVGTYQVDARTRTLTQHWDGSQWSIVFSPNPHFQTFYNELYGVAAVATDDVWAVGFSGNAKVTMILYWDGDRWNVVSSPNPGPSDSRLKAVTKISSSDIWAAGDRSEIASVYTLVERYYDPCITPTPLPSITPILTPSNTPTSTSSATQTFTPTSTSSATSTPIPKSTFQPTASATPTLVVVVTNTPIPSTPTPPLIPTATPTYCSLNFTDVPDTNTFYQQIRCLVCSYIISGYADGTFRPNNEVTRGQLAKIVSSAAGFTENPDPQIFEDVPPSNTFYEWINRLARRGHMSGYACGGVGEPCTTGMPYFRPFANATRGQTSKIVSNAAGYIEIPTDQTFEDVSPSHTFYEFIQRLATRNVMQGYNCGSPGEPCTTGRPYFRPSNDVTRGQSAKIVANTFYPNCNP